MHLKITKQPTGAEIPAEGVCCEMLIFMPTQTHLICKMECCH